MRSIVVASFVVPFALACGGTPADLCGDLVEDRATGSCQCPEGTERGDDVWTCVLPDGGTIRDPNAPDGAVDAGLEHDASFDGGIDGGTDAGGDETDAGNDAGLDAGSDGGCPERVWYRDRDRDGFGDEEDTAAGCTAPDGYVAEGGDCDDECTACTPFASEICDERDNDCDGSEDEGLPQVTCYRDQDGDGFGDETTTMMACGCPEGWTQRSDLFDCYDRNANVFPGQTEYFSTGYCTLPTCVSSPPSARTTSFDYDCNGRERPQYSPESAVACVQNPPQCDAVVVWSDEDRARSCGQPIQPARCVPDAAACTELIDSSTTQPCR